MHSQEKIYYIVDDDVDDQQFLIEALTVNDPDGQCFTALHGREAIKYLSTEGVALPDMLFLDLNMPLLDGKKCLQVLKSTLALSHIPVIIYSTTSNQKEIHDTLKMGASFFIEKKTSFRELTEELQRVIKLLEEFSPAI